MDKLQRMKDLIEILNKASKAYYMDAEEIMSNFEYDKLYDELVELEKELNTVLSNSPTIRVGYEVVSELPKEKHPSPMLSLDKTKEVAALKEWLQDKEGLLSWKMDGLTVVLTYDNGELIKAVTRGNGEVGEVITANAKTFKNIPQKISYKNLLTIRGEAVIKYSDFEDINAKIKDIDAKYKNPRNLCSGSVRQLQSKITAERNVHFFAFNLVDPDDQTLIESFDNSFEERFKFLSGLGFDVVEYKKVNKDTIEEGVKYFQEHITANDFPSDGLVLSYEDVAYGKSLGRTAKFPRNAIAFKWQDEEAETKLLSIEWSPSRTGLINPVAIFETVNLEGTDVKRASVHNVSILKELSLGIGDTIKVYKANMIIPQISENLTRSGNIEIPKICPCCGSETEIKNDNGTETLVCPNPFCPAKNIKLFSHFAERNAMNLDGLSEQTMEKFIDSGFIHRLSDLYHLDNHKDEIINMEGFGEKSYNNIIESIEKSREADMAGFIYGLGISGVGLSNAKLLVKHFDNDIEKIISANAQDISEIDGMGEVLGKNISVYFNDPDNLSEVRRLLLEIHFKQIEVAEEQDLKGLTFVITGSLNNYTNRDELKNEIELRGGKVSGSVSSKTAFLINNDITSNSGKNKKAKELNIPIITEDDFTSRRFLDAN